MLLGQGKKAFGKTTDPGLVRLGQSDGQGAPGGLGPHGGHVAEIHGQGLVADGTGIGIQGKVHPGHQGVHRHDQLLSGGRV
jgi:hypothetical protein